MLTFGLITEGATDQQVIMAILDGYFDPVEIDTRPFLPVADKTQVEHFSNWELVLAYCASPKFKEALRFVDYVVVQIDTDRCDDIKFGIPKYGGGRALEPVEIIERVVARLKECISDTVLAAYGDRIMFAVAVETVECWLLPLYAVGSQRRKHLNCLDTLNRNLVKKNRRPINPLSKDPRYYAELDAPYAKRRELVAHYRENPSLEVCVEQLERVHKPNGSPGDVSAAKPTDPESGA